MRRIDAPLDDARGAARDPAALLDELRLRLARLPPGHPSARPGESRRDGRPGGDADRPDGPGGQDAPGWPAGQESGPGRLADRSFPGLNGSRDDSWRAGLIGHRGSGADAARADRGSDPDSGSRPDGASRPDQGDRTDRGDRADLARGADVVRRGTARGDEPWLADPAARLAAAAGLGAGADGGYRPWFMAGRAGQRGFAPPWFAAP